MFTCGAFIVEMAFMLLTAHVVSIPAVITCLSIAVGVGGFASYRFESVSNERHATSRN